MRSEINVTPLIDVMLVLIIVFMLVVPLKGLDVSLPPSQPEHPARESEPLVLSIAEDGSVTINRVPIERSELPLLLGDIYEARADKSLFVRAHGGLRYAGVVGVLDVARGAGVERIGIVPE